MSASATTRLVLRILLGGVFLFSSGAKLAGGYRGEVPRTIYDSVVSRGAGYHYAMIAFEAGLGLWILSGRLPRAAMMTTVLVLALFSGVIAREYVSKHPRLCGCAVEVLPGENPEAIRRSLLVSFARNLVLIGAAGWGFKEAAGTKAHRHEG